MQTQNNNATCQTCGSPYHVCRSCKEMNDSGIFNWRANCDTPECFQIFLIVLDYRDGGIGKREAKKQLMKLGYEKYIKVDNAVKRIVDSIMEPDYVEPEPVHQLSDDIEECLSESDIVGNRQDTTKDKRHKKG